MNRPFIWRSPMSASLLHVLQCVDQSTTVIRADWLDSVAELTRPMAVASESWTQLMHDLLHRLNMSDQDERSILTECLHDSLGEDGSNGVDLQHLIDQAREVFSSAVANFSREMELRAQPLRNQWQARGPGFLKQLDEIVGIDAAETAKIVVGLLPVRGGWGIIHPTDDCIAMEWLMTDADDHVPELARLAWLVTELKLRRSGDASHVSEEAVDLTLRIANSLDWFPVDNTTRQRAIARWSPSRCE